MMRLAKPTPCVLHNCRSAPASDTTSTGSQQTACCTVHCRPSSDTVASHSNVAQQRSHPITGCTSSPLCTCRVAPCIQPAGTQHVNTSMQTSHRTRACLRCRAAVAASTAEQNNKPERCSTLTWMSSSVSSASGLAVFTAGVSNSKFSTLAGFSLCSLAALCSSKDSRGGGSQVAGLSPAPSRRCGS